MSEDTEKALGVEIEGVLGWSLSDIIEARQHVLDLEQCLERVDRDVAGFLHNTDFVMQNNKHLRHEKELALEFIKEHCGTKGLRRFKRRLKSKTPGNNHS